MAFKSDIEVAQACAKKKITEIAVAAGVEDKYLEQYGNYKAKVDYKLLKDTADEPNGKLILVTAINPTIISSHSQWRSMVFAAQLLRL